MRKLALSAVLGLLAGPALATGLDIEIAGEANGTVHVDLFEDVAPLHVERLTTLAEEGAYDGVWFHRVIDGFMAQTGDVEFAKEGGDMRMAGRGGSQYDDLPAEFSDIPYTRGVVGMARSQNPDSANSQFFIMFTEYPSLNGAYTVVGEVTSGMDVIDQIKRGEGRNGAVMGAPDRMVSVTVTE
ncbi:peptidylprolyl isomerase [Pseudooceanicola antarcticus]|uniref:Peptidyl-prolyl cis-trans isomerase n=1 Tax=Pseudooceanicola antarcticus TaxID=1247613 RepID=A0A285J6L5_9RHOB|nr:peptidylprolyl isomerase [Pseudooceanicola antarcticus]PJE26959.1 peptidylprolyl isomerase [Pseudooceanicola antarcticus]SNY55914.1 peptidylprolyl isomerase [Pseudooceanicola antarcticus]